MLNKLVVVRGILGYEMPVLEVVVDAKARPCVDSGIALLGIGELRRFPIGELLALADFFLKEDGIYLLKAHVGDSELLDHLLELDESIWMGIAHASQLVKVIGRGESDLGNALVLDEFLEWRWNASVIDAEEEGVAGGG